MLSWIRELLFHPDTFFSHPEREKVNFWPPIIIVGLACLFSTESFIVISVVNNAPSGYGLGFLAIWLFILLWLFFETVIKLVLLSVLFSLYAQKSTGAGGSLALTLQNSGYGLLPITILKLPVFCGWVLLYWYHFYYLGLPAPLPETIIWLIMSWGVVLTVAGIFWSGYLWTYGLSCANKIPVKNAFPVVMMIVLVSVLYIIWSEIHSPIRFMLIP